MALDAHPRNVSRAGWKPKLAALALSLGLAWLLGEAALRLVGFSNPFLYQKDDDLGVTLRPGVEGWYRREGEGYVAVNRHGLRDREHAVAKPAGTLRVAVLGDSYAEALQVDRDQTFWAHLERALGTVTRPVEVLNFGVSGYGTAQELLMLRRVWAFDPDVVLLAVTTGNDVRDNSRVLSNGFCPYFVYRDGTLVLDNSFRARPTHRVRSTALAEAYFGLYNRSRVLQLVGSALSRPRAPAALPADPDLRLLTEPGLDAEIYRAPQSPAWAEAWQITEELLRRLRDEVSSHGALLVVVTLSNGIQVHPDPTVRARAQAALGVNDLFYADRRLKEFLEREHVAVLNLAPALQADAEAHQVFLHGFARSGNLGTGHWNEEGHRRAGARIAEWLRGQL